MMMIEVVIIVTGNKGEPLDALEKIVRKHHRDITYQRNRYSSYYVYTISRDGSFDVPDDE